MQVKLYRYEKLVIFITVHSIKALIRYANEVMKIPCATILPTICPSFSSNESSCYGGWARHINVIFSLLTEFIT